MPFVALLLPGGLALFWRLACALARCVLAARRRRGFSSSPLLMPLAEWLRGHVLTGFPWNLSGLWLGRVAGGAAERSLIGAYGLSLLTILFGASLALFARPRPRAARSCRRTDDSVRRLLGGGALRLAAHRRTQSCPACACGWCSPTFAQARKYRAALARRALAATDRSEPRAARAAADAHHLAGSGTALPAGARRRGRSTRLPR